MQSSFLQQHQSQRPYSTTTPSIMHNTFHQQYIPASSSKAYDLEMRLQDLAARRDTLEKRSKEKQQLLSEFTHARQESLARLVNSFADQNEQAKQRNLELLQDVIISIHQSSKKTAAVLASDMNDTSHNTTNNTSFNSSFGQLNSSKSQLLHAKKDYLKSLEHTLPLVHRQEAMRLEEKMKQLKLEKVHSMQRRERLRHELVKEERVRYELESQRQELVQTLALEQTDILRAKASSLLLAEEGKLADQEIVHHMNVIGQQLTASIEQRLLEKQQANVFYPHFVANSYNNDNPSSGNNHSKNNVVVPGTFQAELNEREDHVLRQSAHANTNNSNNNVMKTLAQSVETLPTPKVSASPTSNKPKPSTNTQSLRSSSEVRTFADYYEQSSSDNEEEKDEPDDKEVEYKDHNEPKLPSTTTSNKNNDILTKAKANALATSQLPDSSFEDEEEAAQRKNKKSTSPKNNKTATNKTSSSVVKKEEKLPDSSFEEDDPVLTANNILNKKTSPKNSTHNPKHLEINTKTDSIHNMINSSSSNTYTNTSNNANKDKGEDDSDEFAIDISEDEHHLKPTNTTTTTSIAKKEAAVAANNNNTNNNNTNNSNNNTQNTKSKEEVAVKEPVVVVTAPPPKSTITEDENANDNSDMELDLRNISIDTIVKILFPSPAASNALSPSSAHYLFALLAQQSTRSDVVANHGDLLNQLFRFDDLFGSENTNTANTNNSRKSQVNKVTEIRQAKRLLVLLLQEHRFLSTNSSNTSSSASKNEKSLPTRFAPHVYANALLLLLVYYGPCLVPRDCVTGVVTMEKLKKELKKMSQQGGIHALLWWEELLHYGQTLVHHQPTSPKLTSSKANPVKQNKWNTLASRSQTADEDDDDEFTSHDHHADQSVNMSMHADLLAKLFTRALVDYVHPASLIALIETKNLSSASSSNSVVNNNGNNNREEFERMQRKIYNLLQLELLSSPASSSMLSSAGTNPLRFSNESIPNGAKSPAASKSRPLSGAAGEFESNNDVSMFSPNKTKVASPVAAAKPITTVNNNNSKVTTKAMWMMDDDEIASDEEWEKPPMVKDLDAVVNANAAKPKVNTTNAAAPSRGNQKKPQEDDDVFDF